MIKYKVENYRIIILDNVLSVMNRFIQDNKERHESGGILLGQIEGNNIYVLKCTIPTRYDKSSRFNFERNKEIAQIIINYEFANSCEKTIYIGEWHTHPEDVPTPSSTDKRMIKAQFEKGQLNENFLIMIIQGRRDNFVSLCDGKNIFVADKCLK